MGFQRGLLKLEFEDPELSGLEVRAKRFTVGEMLDVISFLVILETWRGHKDELKEFLEPLWPLLDSKIVDWNYEDDEGMPVPKCEAEIRALDIPMLAAIQRGIIQGTKGVSVPLDKPSGPGGNPMEQTIPMEVLSPPS